MKLTNNWTIFLIAISSFLSGVVFMVLFIQYQKKHDKTRSEINTLSEVIRGLNNLEEEINVNLEDEIEAKTACNYVLYNFQNNAGVTDSLKLSLTLAWVYTHLQPDYGPIEYLTHHPLARISNDKLRDKIVNFYRLELPATVSESKIRQEYIENVKMLMPKWFESFNTNTYNYEAIVPVDYEKMRIDKELLFHLKTQKIETTRYSYELTNMLKHIRQIKKETEAELNKLNSSS